MTFNPRQPRDRSGRWTDGAADLLRKDGGFTLDVNGNPITKGIAVAVPPPGGRRDWLDLPGHATGDDIQKFVDDNAEALRMPNVAVGGWRDTENEKDIIDVSEIHTDPRSAADSALRGRQNSAFDLGSFEEIKTQDLLAKGIESQYDGQSARYGDFEVLRKDKPVRGLKDGETAPHYIVRRADGKGGVKEFALKGPGLKAQFSGDAYSSDRYGHDLAAKYIFDKSGGEADNEPDPIGDQMKADADAKALDVKRRKAHLTNQISGLSQKGWVNFDNKDVKRVKKGNRSGFAVRSAGDDSDRGRVYTSVEDLVAHMVDGESLKDEFKARRPKGWDDFSVLTPALHNVEFDFAKHDGKLAFWKQILPQQSVHYTGKDGKRHQIDFTKDYLTDLASNKAVDKVGFLLADKDNAHTMDPERWRGEVVAMEVRDDGLYGKIVFPSVEAAKAVIDNPELGVSARIREGVSRSDGSTVSRGIIHVLGTLDPQVSGMSSWQTTDLSTDADDVLDLSNENYEDTMTDQTKALADYTEAEIDAMTEEELDAFLAAHVPDFDAYTETIEVKEPEAALAGAGADMSNEAKVEIDLATQAVAHANARADEALRRVAEAEWREERASYIAEGVPPHALDLAMPVLNRADDMVIDLSNTDEDDVNASAIIRGLLDAMKGTVDLSNEDGHNGTFVTGKDGEDPDKEVLDRWLAQS